MGETSDSDKQPMSSPTDPGGPIPMPDPNDPVYPVTPV
jgi:hypothetical protein